MQETPALRPLGVGDIVDRVIVVLRARPMLYIVLAGLPALAVAVLERAVGISRTFDLNDFVPQFLPNGQPVLPTGAQRLGPGESAAEVIGALVAVVQGAALTDAVARQYLGRAATVGDSFRHGLEATPRLLGALVVSVVITAVIFGLLLVVVSTIAFLVSPVLFLLFLPVVFGLLPYLLVSWSVALPAAIAEGTGPIASLRRSWRLVSGARWRVLGLLLILFVLQIVVGILFSTLFVVSFVADPILKTVLQEAANLGTTIILTPLLVATLVVLYYDLRVRKEALDLQLAAESLPREA